MVVLLKSRPPVSRESNPSLQQFKNGDAQAVTKEKIRQHTLEFLLLTTGKSEADLEKEDSDADVTLDGEVRWNDLAISFVERTAQEADGVDLKKLIRALGGDEGIVAAARKCCEQQDVENQLLTENLAQLQ